jgi:acetyl esterase/lipase
MAKWPAQLHDCKGAIRFLKANAKQYHLDTTRFGAWGNSAGGHLAAMIGTSTDAAGTREYTVGSTTMDMEGNIGGNTNVTSKVQAVCNWFGPTDFLRMNDTPTSIDHLSPSSPESQLLGCPVLECPEKAELANPVHFITEDDPYFLTMHGDIDDVVPLVASVLFDSALRAHNVNSIFKIIPNEGHGFAAQWFDTAAEFFRWRFYEQTQSVSKAPEVFYVSPNPTDGDVRIHAAAGSSIRLYDVLGSHYTVTIRAEDNDAVITLPQHSGIYYCLIEKGNMIRRVMLMRR